MTGTYSTYAAKTTATLRHPRRWQSALANYVWVDVPAGTTVDLVDEPGATIMSCGAEYVRIIVRGIEALEGAERLAKPGDLGPAPEPEEVS
jgi:hypothetical protein